MSFQALHDPILSIPSPHSSSQALDYRQRILDAVPPSGNSGAEAGFLPLMALYLTDR